MMIIRGLCHSKIGNISVVATYQLSGDLPDAATEITLTSRGMKCKLSTLLVSHAECRPPALQHTRLDGFETHYDFITFVIRFTRSVTSQK